MLRTQTNYFFGGITLGGGGAGTAGDPRGPGVVGLGTLGLGCKVGLLQIGGFEQRDGSDTHDKAKACNPI